MCSGSMHAFCRQLALPTCLQPSFPTGIAKDYFFDTRYIPHFDYACFQTRLSLGAFTGAAAADS
jgi:hypothetical protein